LPEIDTSLRSKIKRQLAPVKGAFYIEKIHLETQFADALQTKGVGTVFSFPVSFNLKKIFFTRQPENLFEGSSRVVYIRVTQWGRRNNHFAETESPIGFHDDMIALFQNKSA